MTTTRQPWYVAGIAVDGVNRAGVAEIKDLEFTWRNAGDDSATFAVHNTRTATFTYGTMVKIYRGTGSSRRLWFHGPVVDIAPNSSVQEDYVTIRLGGGWSMLASVPYRHTWMVLKENETELTPAALSRVILYRSDADNSALTAGQQMAAAVAYAAGHGADMTLVTSTNGSVHPPAEDALDLTCADVVARCLRWDPSLGVCFTPTEGGVACHIVSVSSGAATVLTRDMVSSYNIKPRYDLQVQGVTLSFESLITPDGANGERSVWHAVQTQTAGATDGYNVVHATLELSGAATMNQVQYLRVVPWPADLNDKEFWKQHDATLADVALEDIEIEAGARTGEKNLPSIVVAGEIHTWMRWPTGDYFDRTWHDCQQEPEVLSCKMSLIMRDEEGEIVYTAKKIPVTIHVLSTDAVTRLYRRMETTQFPEVIPSGLATALYSAWSHLYYEGQIVRQDEELPGTVRAGRRVSLTGVVSGALVSQVDEVVSTGTTTIRVAPPAHIGISEMRALLRTFRGRAGSDKLPERDTDNSRDRFAAGVAGFSAAEMSDADKALLERLLEEGRQKARHGQARGIGGPRFDGGQDWQLYKVMACKLVGDKQVIGLDWTRAHA